MHLQVQKLVVVFTCTCPAETLCNLYIQCDLRWLTGEGRVERKRPEVGQFLSACFLHAGSEDVLPCVELQQLDSPQQLVGFLQSLTGVFL